MQSLTLGMSYTGAGKTLLELKKTIVSQSFYGTLNGAILCSTEALQIDVWGRNLTNKDYTTFYFETMHRGFETKKQTFATGGGYTLSLLTILSKNKKGVTSTVTPFLFPHLPNQIIFCHT